MPLNTTQLPAQHRSLNENLTKMKGFLLKSHGTCKPFNYGNLQVVHRNFARLATGAACSAMRLISTNQRHCNQLPLHNSCQQQECPHAQPIQHVTRSASFPKLPCYTRRDRKLPLAEITSCATAAHLKRIIHRADKLPSGGPADFYHVIHQGKQRNAHKDGGSSSGPTMRSYSLQTPEAWL